MMLSEVGAGIHVGVGMKACMNGNVGMSGNKYSGMRGNECR